ncbi:glycosyltransferase family 4 protein [Actinoplanes sp. NBC_00393]|uniref:glycosyltransferase family 4 protein n=1 Tax=Actinoplanes sp. NBC_00393 TaxID=2975953 RepID=UPI002E1E3395
MTAPEVLIARPTAGGVAHVGAKVVGEFRRQGRDVLDVPLAESAAPAWRGLLTGLRAAGRIRRAGVIHIELGRITTGPFWFAVVAVSLRRDVVLVVHDAPTLVDAPGAAVVPARRGWRDAVAHKVFAPLLDRPVTLYVRRRAGVVAVLSEVAARQSSAAGFKRVERINHGADPALPGPLPSTSRTVVFGGFLSPAKGLEDLLAAWEEAGSDHQLMIAGTASRQHAEWVARLQRESAKFANPPRWLGYLGDQEFAELIASASVVVLPYRAANPASGILVRAMVQGRAVLATRVPAMESLVTDGVTGCLVDVGDTGGLARELANLLSDPTARDRLGAAAAEVAAVRHTWARQASDLDRIYAVAGGTK